MNEAYNADRTMTLGMAEDLVLMAVNSVKEWTMTNVDKTEIMKHIKAQLDIANRQVVGTTAAEKCQYLINCIDAITGALRSAGAIVPDETPLAEYATLVRQISASGYEVCILGKSGTHYAADEWLEYERVHGTTPETGAVVAVITPFHSFVIAPAGQEGYKNLQWGNTTDSVTGLYGQQTGSFINVLQNSLNFRSLENTYRMLLWYDPEVLPHINYDPNDPDKDYGAYACIRFANHAEMEKSGQHLMYDQQVYIVTEDTDGTANVSYYWSGNGYTKRFVVPRVANNITGSPAAKHAWTHVAYDGDPRQWTLPTTNHLLMMYVYYTPINTCLSVLDRSPLPTGNSWSCQQNNASYAYYVTIPSASVGNYNKTNTYAVVPVAAL